MSDQTTVPPAHEADILTSLVLMDLMVLRPLVTGPNRTRLETAVSKLKTVLARLREIDPSLPDVTVNDPHDQS